MSTLILPKPSTQPDLYHGKWVAGLFASGEQGAWYDPSDLSTLYQDAAGTTPVTAVEQPVGLILDKSKGLVLGPELVTNGDFSNGTTGWTTGPGGTISVSGGQLTGVSGGTSNIVASQAIAAVIGRTYEIRWQVVSVNAGTGSFVGLGGRSAKFAGGAGTRVARITTAITGALNFYGSGANSSVTIDNISVRELLGNHAYQSTSASRPVLSARVNQYLNTTTLATQSVTTLATTYTLRFDGAGSITLSGAATGTYTAGAHSVVCTAGTLTSTVTGTVTNADLRPTNAGVNLPPYQRVTTSTDYDTAGFPMYLRFDGVDDYLSTGSINFTATDKMTVLSGARAFDGHIYNTIVAQNYPNSPGWYQLLKRNLPSELCVENSRRGSGSSAFTNTPNDFGGLYDGNIVTAYAFDLARTPELVTQRVNGAVKINGYGIDSGVGPLANAPLYIGSINATQHRLTGNLYGLIVRGAQTDDDHLTHAEQYLAYKSGVTL